MRLEKSKDVWQTVRFLAIMGLLILFGAGCKKQDQIKATPVPTSAEPATATTQTGDGLNTFPTATPLAEATATPLPPTDEPTATKIVEPTPTPTKTARPATETPPPTIEPTTEPTTNISGDAKAILATRNKRTATSTTATQRLPTATHTPKPPATHTPKPPVATNTATWTPPTATRTATWTPPTATRTATWTPPTKTNTPRPPTATATRRPPTATATRRPPTAIPATATATPIPPTATDTPAPPTATPIPTPSQPAEPLDFNFFITGCAYDEGNWRCDMTIAPSGGSGQGYIIKVYDSDPPATYETNGNQNHVVIGRRCFAWVHQIDLIDAGTQELFTKDVYIDPNSPPVSDFLGGSCTMP